MRTTALIAALLFAAASPAFAAQPEAAPDLAALRARAEAGDAGAQVDLGRAIFNPNNPAALLEARALFQRSMQAGNAEAKGNYALMLMMGFGGPADVELGRRLRAEAAAQGSMAANMTLAERYLYGEEGYPVDMPRAFGHMRVVAESSTPSAAMAQYRLGQMHLQGLGTPANKEEGYRWIARAAEAGDVDAMATRAVLLTTGDGVAEDGVAARDWARRAAESGRQGYESGLRVLGWLLVGGKGGPVDLPTGLAYLTLAAAAGETQAQELIDELRSRITPEIESQARAIGERWTAEHPLT
jgi:TPR repeat protein